MSRVQRKHLSRLEALVGLEAVQVGLLKKKYSEGSLIERLLIMMDPRPLPLRLHEIRKIR